MRIKKTDRIAVTGGTGFAGSHILRDLVEQGFTDIVALRRKESRMDLVSDIESKIQWVKGDVLEVNSLEDCFDKAVGVIHAAAKVSYNPKDRVNVMTINVEGSGNVVNVALHKKVKKLIFISSVAALGRSLEDKIIDEEVEWQEDSDTSFYARSKHLAEMEVWRGMYEGLNVGVLNPSMILGPAYWGESSTKLFTHVTKQSRFYPPGSNGFVDVRDLAELTTRYLLSEVHGKRVIVVSEMYSYKKLLELIAIELSMRPPNIELGPLMSCILWRLLAFAKDPAITKETVAITSKDFNYDNSRSEDLFSFDYRPIELSIKETCEILKKNLSSQQDFGFFPKIRS